jgi:antitoxin component YwqK of YwqJK toxin-antitoxin module
MMKSFFVLLALFIFIACDQPQPKETAASNPKFQLDGTIQQVVSKHADGSPKVSLFLDEKTNAKVARVEFHSNGQPKIDERFSNDVRQGEAWCYYDDGKPWSLNTFNQGLNDGPYKTWHENGQLYIQGQYAAGKENGEWLTYYANGALNTRGFYAEGKKIGMWYSYNLEGTMKREQDFGSATP